MKKFLLVVESPAKIKTLKKFLGKNFSLASSVGHIRDLPKKGFGVDIEHGFEPQYVNLPEKKEVIQKLKKAAKEVDVVYLCPDPDREGEAIAWHIASILPKSTKIKRVTFNSITKNVVLEALKHPRDVNLSLVDAQKARRILDRIVGYTISPILTRKIKRGRKGTSAGRVQSVALKFVVDREKEIDDFKPVEYWTIKTKLNKKRPFEATLYSVDGKRIEKEKKEKKDIFLIPNKKVADEITKKLEKSSFVVKKVDKKEKKRNPVPPFITSTLQQEASRHYRFAVSRTMGIAQTLYEGIDIDGFEGLITYMRTDSVNVAKEAIEDARKFIEKNYGKENLPDKPLYYASKKSAQEAHEAIRPTNMENTPSKVKKYLTTDQYKLYLLIWNRFISSQMKPAIYDTVSLSIEADNMILRASGSLLKFKGFLMLYEEREDGEEKEIEKLLPMLAIGDKLDLIEVIKNQSFTIPPPRFTEASLVKELERSGIGRPSTYAAIMKKIQSREYTIKEKNSLRPTELGKVIARMVEENFPPIMNVGFTAAMEDDLELVAENKRDWRALIKEFWEAFMPMVEKAEKEAQVPRIKTNLKCPKCKSPLLKIWSVDNYFYGCSRYPDCDYTATLESLEFKKEDYSKDFDWEQKCPKCGSDMILKHGRYGPFLGCSKYPDCQGIISIPKKGEEALQPKDRPDCPALGCDGKIVMRRSRYGKIFYSCTNFPECNVIVNDLKSLEPKYDAHHPKTAYEKKKRGEGGKLLYKLSDELKAIVEQDEATRAEVLKGIWAYIKSHNLQNPENKREIVADDKLKKLFGGKDRIDMMKLAGIIKNHIKK